MALSMSQRLLFVAAIILTVYLAVRLVDYAQVATVHPLSSEKHDIYSYLPQLYFLKVCGFHEPCPYWYGGFVTFITSPPGWYFFAYPFYLLTDNILLAFYLGIAVIYVAGFFLVWRLGKRVFRSSFASFFLFAFIFGNNVAINSLRLGRAPEILAFFSFVVASLILFSYKDRAIDKFFFLIVPFFALTILSYHSIAILLSFLFLGLLFVKRGMERFLALLAAGTSFLITSFWWIPLLLALSKTVLLENAMGVEAWWMFRDFLHFTSAAVIVLPLALFAVAYLAFRSGALRRNDFIFFVPSFALVLAFFLGVIPFIPILRHIFTNIYFLFIIFLTLSLFLQIKLERVSPVLQRLLPVVVFCAAVATVLVSFVNTPLFDRPTQDQNDFKDLFEDVNGSFLIVGDLSIIGSHRSAFASYAPIFKNLTTISGHYPVLAYRERLGVLQEITRLYSERRCDELQLQLKDERVAYLLSAGSEPCEMLERCGFSVVQMKGLSCLYSV